MHFGVAWLWSLKWSVGWLVFLEKKLFTQKTPVQDSSLKERLWSLSDVGWLFCKFPVAKVYLKLLIWKKLFPWCAPDHCSIHSQLNFPVENKEEVKYIMLASRYRLLLENGILHPTGQCLLHPDENIQWSDELVFGRTASLVNRTLLKNSLVWFLTTLSMATYQLCPVPVSVKKIKFTACSPFGFLFLFCLISHLGSGSLGNVRKLHYFSFSSISLKHSHFSSTSDFFS